MPSIQELRPLLAEPREDLGAEYKSWLNLTENEGKAIVAKAAIALANHGGGFLIIGFDEVDGALTSAEKPVAIPEITQDLVNSAIRRFSNPEFHCEIYNVRHPVSNFNHVVISVPGGLSVPVMSKRDLPNIISQNRCYIRKSGPRSEEPQTGEEWRTLIDRCIRAGREDMLEAIRSIVSGKALLENVPAGEQAKLRAFCDAGRERWQALVENLPNDDPARLSNGYYEMGFSLIGAERMNGLGALRENLSHARRVKLTGWTPFLDMGTPEWAPYPHEDFIEAWVGRPVPGRDGFREPAVCDFWRASPEGSLYTIRGFSEDAPGLFVSPGIALDITMPIWRVGEGLLFASRVAEQVPDVEAIAIFIRFAGLEGRSLASFTGFRTVHREYSSHTPEVIMTGEASLARIRDNLAEVVHQVLVPLYERFGFFELSMVLVEEQLDRLRRRHL